MKLQRAVGSGQPALFRAVYTKHGYARGMTFAVPAGLFASEEAVRFAERVVMTYARSADPASLLLTVKGVRNGA